MSVLPANTSSLPPTETLFFAGWLKGNYREQTVATGGLLGIGGNFTGPWEDVSGYCEFRLVTYSDVGSVAGGVLIQWSFDGVNIHATEAAATAVGLAVYDSGIIAYHYPYVRVNYTNGAGAQLVAFQMRMIVSPTAVGGGGGGAPIIGIVGQGAPGPVALAWPVELTAPQWSLPAPNPASVAGALAAGKLDPDRALAIRGRILTDEDSFADDFGDGAVAMVRALTGLCTFTLASTAVVGQAGVSLFTTEVRVGDYVALNADGAVALAQVASITDNTHLTLAAAYTGAGGAAGASSVQNYFEQIVGAAGNGVAAGIMTLDVTAANGDDTLIMRAIGAGGRKSFLPVKVGFYSAIDQRRANQLGELGVYNPITGELARFLFDGALNTVVKATAQSSATAGDLWDEAVTLPSAGITSAYHWYEIILYADRAVFFIDHQRVAEHPYHLPDPYTPLWLYAELQNTGASGVTNLTTDWLGYNCFDDVRAEVTQPDGAKLHATIDAMPAIAVNVDLQGQVESLPAPSPSSIRGALADLALLEEPDHALRTRARALTDEGAFNDDFNYLTGFAYDALPGTITIAPGATALVGTAAAIAALKAGDYVQVAADNNPAVPAWTQVLSIDTATTATLAAGYAGAVGGALAVGWRSAWSIQYTGAGAGITTAASVVTFTPAPGAAGVALLTRHVGVGNRKGFRPVRIIGDPALSAIRANQLGVFGFANGPDPLTATAYAAVRAEDETTLRVTVIRDTFLTDDDYVLPNGGLTSAGHLIELEWTNNGVNLWVDRVLALAGVGSHIADPYDELWAMVGVINTGNPGGATLLTANIVETENVNLLDARVTNPDASKLHATVKDTAVVQSLAAPNPSAILGAVSQSLQLEPDHALRTRARVLTDEGSFAGNFPGASLYRALTGGANITMTAGSTAVTGVGTLFTTEVRVGDYVEITAQHSDTVPVLVQVQSIESNLALTLRTAWAGVTATGAAQVSDWYVIRTALGGEAIAVAAGEVTMTVTGVANERVTLARRLGPGGRKGCAPLWARFAANRSAANANQAVLLGFTSALGSAATWTQCAYFSLGDAGVATTVRTGAAFSLATGIESHADRTYSDGYTSASHLIYELLLLEDQAEFYVNGEQYGTAIAVLPTPYQEMFVVCQIENTGASAGAVLAVPDVHVKSLDIVDARCVQPDASKLNVTVGGEAGAAMIAVGTYLPGWNGEFYGPTAALVAATPTLLMVSPAGGYYAVTVDPTPAAGERVRTLWSRPIPVTGVGYTGFTLTGAAQITVGGTILPNIVVGQFVYFTADGAAFAQRVTVVAPGAGLTVLTLAANYLGAAAPGLGSVCGIATATYATVPPISDGTSPVVLGPLAAQDVLIVYADAAYAGGIVGVARAS